MLCNVPQATLAHGSDQWRANVTTGRNTPDGSNVLYETDIAGPWRVVIPAKERGRSVFLVHAVCTYRVEPGSFAILETFATVIDLLTQTYDVDCGPSTFTSHLRH